MQSPSLPFEKEHAHAHEFFSHVIDKPLHYRLNWREHESRQIAIEIHFPQKQVEIIQPATQEEYVTWAEFKSPLWHYIVSLVDTFGEIPEKLIIIRRTGKGWKKDFQEQKTERYEFLFSDVEEVIRGQFKQHIRNSLNSIIHSPENTFGKFYTREIPFDMLCRLFLLQGHHNELQLFLTTKLLPCLKNIRLKSRQPTTPEKVQNIL